MRGRRISLFPFALVALAASLAPKPAHAALVGYWSFDGCTTTDASGNGRNLTAQGSPNCVAGRFGNAWELNGTSQYLDRGTDLAFSPGFSHWSVAAWVKTSVASPYCGVLSWYRCGANPVCNLNDGALYALTLTDGHPGWNVRDDNLDDILAQDRSLNLADGAWHFLVGTENEGTDSLKLYIDGALDTTATAPLTSVSAGGIPIPLEVGRWFRTGWGSPDYYFPGAIDEVRIFSDELTAGNVASLYNFNTTGVEPGEEPVALAIEGLAPNPTRGGPLRVSFTIAGITPARLAVFDVSGRLVAERAFGTPSAGHHVVDLAESGRLAPGVYLIRLSQGARSRARRVTVLQ